MSTRDPWPNNEAGWLEGLDDRTQQEESETWGHWCYEQEPVHLPIATPRCPQCGALDLNTARSRPPADTDTGRGQ